MHHLLGVGLLAVGVPAKTVDALGHEVDLVVTADLADRDLGVGVGWKKVTPALQPWGPVAYAGARWTGRAGARRCRRRSAAWWCRREGRGPRLDEGHHGVDLVGVVLSDHDGDPRGADRAWRAATTPLVPARRIHVRCFGVRAGVPVPITSWCVACSRQSMHAVHDYPPTHPCRWVAAEQTGIPVAAKELRVRTIPHRSGAVRALAVAALAAMSLLPAHPASPQPKRLRPAHRPRQSSTAASRAALRPGHSRPRA